MRNTHRGGCTNWQLRNTHREGCWHGWLPCAQAQQCQDGGESCCTKMTTDNGLCLEQASQHREHVPLCATELCSLPHQHRASSQGCGVPRRQQTGCAWKLATVWAGHQCEYSPCVAGTHAGCSPLRCATHRHPDTAGFVCFIPCDRPVAVRACTAGVCHP